VGYRVAAKEGRPLNYGFSSSWGVARTTVIGGIPGDGTIRAFFGAPVVANWGRLTTAAETQKILGLVEEGLREGGIGVGVLLGYAPLSNYEEYLAVAKLAKRHGAPVFTHLRYAEPYGPKNSLAAHEELIALAAMTGAHMHICHLNSTASRRIPEMLDAVESARSRGLKVTFEAYPYGAGCTKISAAFLAPANLPNMGLKPSDLVYLKTGERPASDERLTQLRMEDPNGLVIVHVLDESRPEDLKLIDKAILHADAAIASDAIPWQVEGKTITGKGWPLPPDAVAHPRSAGCFSRILGRFVRQDKKLSLVQALRKCSLLPAQILEESVPQMKKKGRIQVGADADVIVFNPEKVIDRATYLKPNQPSLGMRHVMVNGAFVIKDGHLQTGSFPGRPVRRPVE
jgi:hypothetical protein